MFTEKQLAQYRDDGFIVADYRLPEQTLEALRRDVEALVGDDPNMRQLTPTILDHDQCFIKYANDPEILNRVEQLAGSDLALWNMSLFGKPAHDGKKVPWHQDGEYWPIRPLATTRVWIALDAASRDNGCLCYVRGSHKRRELYAHHEAEDHSMLFQYGIRPEEIDPDDVFELELQPGEMAIHDVFMVHGSQANSTDHNRRAIVLNFMPTTSYFDHDLAAKQFAEMDIDFDHSRRSLFLLRGVDRCGRNDFQIGHTPDDTFDQAAGTSC